MWQPLRNLRDLNPTEGLIRLWHNQNFMRYSKWSTKGEYGKDIFYYFFIPSEFYYVGEDTFAYNFSFKYIKEPVEVYHKGIQHSEAFWRLEPQGHPEVSIQTDRETKLPFIIVPDVGQPNYKMERRYFIPLGQNV